MTPKTAPFLRWAGGKTWLLPYLGELINGLEYKNYYEPFLGGAAVFFSLSIPKHAYLSDINYELIETYTEVRDKPEKVIEILATFPNTEKDYYKIRATEFVDATARAARFIYLNYTSYNGLYRVNRKGKYNVPYGFREKIIYDFEKIRIASQGLQKVELNCEDFSANKHQIEEGDLVFLDPPYTVSHNQNGFIKYNQKLFSLEDQYRLSKYIDYIKKKGAYYVLTNAAHETILEIFGKCDRTVILNRNSLIGGKNSQRGKTSEYIFTNIPEKVHMDE